MARQFDPPSPYVQKNLQLPIGGLPVDVLNQVATEKAGESYIRRRMYTANVRERLLRHQWLIVASGMKWNERGVASAPDEVLHMEGLKWSVRCQTSRGVKVFDAYPASLVLDTRGDPIMDSYSRVEIVTVDWAKLRRGEIARKMRVLYSRLVPVPVRLTHLLRANVLSSEV